MPEKKEASPEFESRLLPILREAVDIVKMLFFKRIKETLASRYPERESSELGKVAGAVINELFGVVNPDPVVTAFREKNQGPVDETLSAVPEFIGELQIPLSDALRMHVLCDFQEDNVDNSTLLARAGELGILLLERDLPMPHSFLDMVRRVGKAYGLILPPNGSEK